MIINLKGSEVAVNTTPSTFGNTTCVRVVATANTVLTLKDSGNNTIGTCTMLGGTSEYVQKAHADTIQASVNALGVSVGFTIE
jgi:hypothetical protein